MDFLALLESAGFSDAEIVAETGFNTSAVTKGVLLRARKVGEAAKQSASHHYGKPATAALPSDPVIEPAPVAPSSGAT